MPNIESEDENLQEATRAMISAMPFSVIGSVDDVTTPDGRVVKGREYIWGVAEGEPKIYHQARITHVSRKRGSLRLQEATSFAHPFLHA